MEAQHVEVELAEVSVRMVQAPRIGTASTWTSQRPTSPPRNLWASQHRHRSVQDRHIHELAEHGNAPDPEQRTLDDEEASALPPSPG